MNMLLHRSRTKKVSSLFAAIILSSSRRIVVPSRGLNIAILSGSTRNDGPPRPILTDRVTKYIERSLEGRQHNVSVTNAKDLPLMVKPHFAYSKSQTPENLSKMQAIFEKADAYIVCSPEYNHSPCPGLLNLMNHFGSSVFSFKPSGIVSYSAGQWGGTRAAHALRPFLSELGCLPVSAMIHIPHASQVLDENGKVCGGIEEEERWHSYVDRMISQVEWWAKAAQNQRRENDPFQSSPTFNQTPSQRNAPSQGKK